MTKAQTVKTVVLALPTTMVVSLAHVPLDLKVTTVKVQLSTHVSIILTFVMEELATITETEDTLVPIAQRDLEATTVKLIQLLSQIQTLTNSPMSGLKTIIAVILILKVVWLVQLDNTDPAMLLEMELAQSHFLQTSLISTFLMVIFELILSSHPTHGLFARQIQVLSQVMTKPFLT